jgi:HD-GYP domain-containing protein (c-di-GMP phosphodiesterase class II)
MNRLRQQTIDEAKDIINRLAICFKISQTYSIENEALLKAVDAFVMLLRPLLLAGKNVEIELLGDYFYMNEARVRYPAQYYINFDFLMSEFRKRGLGSIAFSGDIEKNHLLELIVSFNSCMSSDVPFIQMMGDIELVEPIDIGPLKKMRQDGLTDVRRMVKRSYFNAVSNLRSIMTRLQRNDNTDIKKTRVAVNSLIDLMLTEEQMLFSMTAIKDYDEYTYHHSVNVSILSLAMGMRLSFSKKLLSELGIAAMLHDIGKVNIPGSILNKVAPFSEDEWKLIWKHPTEGVKIILSSMKIDPITVRSSIVSFEHHRNYDGTGYPKVVLNRPLDLFSNIITIADRFDAMTSTRVYARAPRPPEEALNILAERVGRDVDEALLKIFIRMIGHFPIGSMVALNTHEMGIVCMGNSDVPDRPMVNLLFDSQGNRVHNVIIDLAEQGEDGNYLRAIIKTIDPFKYGINVSEYLLDSVSVA